MPKVSGMDILAAVKVKAPEMSVVLMTAYGTIEAAVRAVKLGASDYVCKPFKNDEICKVVERTLFVHRLVEENRRLKAEVGSRSRLGDLVGKSPKMRQVYDLIGQLARTDTTVLIQGASGTGKELAARALHYNSARSDRPFMAIHCGALPETLLESELFGHIKGAFTDAMRDKTGLLESAAGGTVFFDEVAEMPPPLQIKLLRFLQDHEVRPLGSTESRKVDVRIVAATNKDLRQEVARGKFREDLFYRLAVVLLQLPPLRERKEDIPLLVECFLERESKKRGETLSIEASVLDVLMNHEWPGNVRELENVMAHAFVLSKSAKITLESLPSSLAALPKVGAFLEDHVPYREAKQRILASFDRAYLKELLHRSEGNVSRAARLADMDRKNFYELLKKNGLMPGSEAAPDGSSLA